MLRQTPLRRPYEMSAVSMFKDRILCLKHTQVSTSSSTSCSNSKDASPYIEQLFHMVNRERHGNEISRRRKAQLRSIAMICKEPTLDLSQCFIRRLHQLVDFGCGQVLSIASMWGIRHYYPTPKSALSLHLSRKFSKSSKRTFIQVPLKLLKTALLQRNRQPQNMILRRRRYPLPLPRNMMRILYCIKGPRAQRRSTQHNGINNARNSHQRQQQKMSKNR